MLPTRPLFHALVALLMLFPPLFSAKDFYVTPNPNCGINCKGDESEPFDNFFLALNAARSFDSSTINLLYGSTTPHVAFLKEIDSVDNTVYYDLTQNSSFGQTISGYTSIALQLNNVIIKPLYCDEPVAISTFPNNCALRNESVRVYLKTTNVIFYVTGEVQIEGVIFDGIHDISLWNPSSAALDDCLYKRPHCCAGKDVTSINSLRCVPVSSNYSSLSINSGAGLFLLEDSVSDGASLTFTNVRVRNFISPQLSSFVQTKGTSTKLFFNGVVVDNVFFNYGLIYHAVDSSTIDDSTIKVYYLTFSNYNYWNLLKATTNRNEGYLFYSKAFFSGSLEVKYSNFVNMTTSVRDQCWLQTKSFYKAPMNNLLLTEPRSRSDIWNQYHQDHLARNLTSSVISLKTLSGSVTLDNSNFANIIGTSGSVLHIDETTSSKTHLTITSCKFDNNFAYDGFANILVAHKNNPEFSSMLTCPHIEITDSKFLNAYGCPGSYGNIASICYWDSTPPQMTALSDYSVSTNIAADYYGSPGDNDDLIDFWLEDSQDYAYIKIKNTLFENNQLSLSNSLAIVGGYFTILENNTFQNNGGTTGNISASRLQDSYFVNRHPSQSPSNFSIHFGQSTSVYFDRIIKIYSKDNTFDGNWGPWEGSLALGSSLTIKNWLSIQKSLISQNDKFINHNGITLQGSMTGPNDKTYTPPIIAISFDHDGSESVSEVNSTIIQATNILMNGVTFDNNTASYDYTSFNYNPKQLGSIITNIMKDRMRYRTGLIKLLSTYEATDLPSNILTKDNPNFKVGFSILNGQITYNKLLTEGCLFPTLWAKSFMLGNSNIASNEVYTADQVFPQNSSNSSPSLASILQSRTGLFCLSSQESFETLTSIQMTATDLEVSDNKGVLFSIYPRSSSSLYLMNSRFQNNTCNHSSIISIYNSGNIISVNNAFIENYSPLGNVFLGSSGAYMGWRNTYIRNNGVHASLIFINDAAEEKSYEIMGRAYLNDVSPKYKLFIGKIAPQAGLYYVNSGWLELNQIDFRENLAYSGLITSYDSIVTLIASTVFDHKIIGTSILGNFMDTSAVQIDQTQIINSSISQDPQMANIQAAVILIFTSKLTSDSLEIREGFAENEAVAIFGNTIEATIKNLILKDFHNSKGGQIALIRLMSSTVEIDNLQCSNVTNLFSLMLTKLQLTSVSVSNLVPKYESQFLLDMSSTTLTVKDLTYTTNGEYGGALPLIGGEHNTVQFFDSTFTRPTGNNTQLFGLKSSKLFAIINSVFEYGEEFALTTVLDLSSSDDIVISKCIFILASRVLKALETRQTLHFSGNTLILGAGSIENPHIQFTDGKDSYVLDNNLIGLKSSFSDISQPKIKVMDSSGDSLFQSNKYISLCGADASIHIRAETVPYSVTFKDEIFINNTGSNGGAVQLYVNKGWREAILPQATIENSVFIRNNAINNIEDYGRGGAIYQTSPSETRQKTVIKNSSFVKNTADRIGGAIYFDYTPPEMGADSKFLNNFATRLNHIGSYPVKLVQLDANNSINFTYVPSNDPIQFSNHSETYYWSEIPSGPTSDKEPIFAVLDMYNQVVYDDNSSIIEVFPLGLNSDMREVYSNKLVVKAQNGLYNYEKFEFTFKVGERIVVTFNSSAMPEFKATPINDLVILPSALVNVSFRLCNLGEFLVPLDYGFDACHNCEPSFWQLIPNSKETSCRSCDETKAYCMGGNNVGPKRGYWRLNATADVVLKCPVEDACLGNVVSGDVVGPEIDLTGKCAEGYKGNGCGNCEEGYGKLESGECQSCDNSWWPILQLVGILVLQFYVVSTEVKEIMEINESFLVKDKIKTDIAILLRILMNYFQLISVAQTAHIEWPDFIGEVLSVNSRLSSFTNQLLNFDCFFTTYYDDLQGTMAFLKILFAALSPIIFILLCYMFWIVCFIVTKRPILNNKEFLYRVVTSSIIICFTMQPLAITKSFTLFQCENLYREDSPLYFLTADYDVPCWQGIHKYWVLGLGIPALVLWIFILPIMLFFLLSKNKRKLKIEKIAKKYSFMYIGYRKEKYYWEFIIMLRKILLISSIIIASFHSVELQIYFSVILTIVAYVLHVRNQPYSEVRMNDLESVSLLSSEVVNFSGLYFQIIKRSEALDLALMTMGLLGNAFFFFFFARIFFKVQIESLKRNRHFMLVYTFLRDKICCCFKSQSFWRKLGVRKAIEFAVMDPKKMKKLELDNPTITSPDFADDNNAGFPIPKSGDITPGTYIISSRPLLTNIDGALTARRSSKTFAGDELKSAVGDQKSFSLFKHTKENPEETIMKVEEKKIESEDSSSDGRDVVSLTDVIAAGDELKGALNIEYQRAQSNRALSWNPTKTFQK